MWKKGKYAYFYTHTHTHSGFLNSCLKVPRVGFLLALGTFILVGCQKEDISENSKTIIEATTLQANSGKMTGICGDLILESLKEEEQFLSEILPEEVHLIAARPILIALKENEEALNRIFGDINGAMIGLKKDTITYSVPLVQGDSVLYSNQIKWLESHMTQVWELESKWNGERRIFAIDLLTTTTGDISNGEFTGKGIVLSLANQYVFNEENCTINSFSGGHWEAAAVLTNRYNNCPIKDYVRGYVSEIERVPYGYGEGPNGPFGQYVFDSWWYLDDFVYSNQNGNTVDETLASTWSYYLGRLRDLRDIGRPNGLDNDIVLVKPDAAGNLRLHTAEFYYYKIKGYLSNVE